MKSRATPPAESPAATSGSNDHDRPFSLSASKPETWKLLIVDDEEEVHKLTLMALEDFTFEERGLHILSAFSAEEAKTMIRDNPDTALILLDVIMETDDAGLQLVRFIRETLENNIVQIVLRTGQPGLTPQKAAISSYEINGYTSKVELTAEKMFSTVTASLRAYWLSFSLSRLNLQLQTELAVRKEAEEKIRRLTQFQEIVIDNANIWLDVKDTENNIVIWNKAAERISGYSRDEVIGDSAVLRWLYPQKKDMDRIQQRLADLLTGRAVSDDFETAIQNKGGQQKIISWDHRELRDAHGALIGVVSLGRDITEHRKLETQLRQAQKMEAVGRMAGGLAHDFNNLLTVIRGYCDIALARLDPKDQVHARIKRIEKAANQAESLTRQLLSFSRHQVLSLRAVNLNTLVRDMTKMLSRLMGAGIELKTRYDAQIGNIWADYSQIEQVIINLVINAKDAMPEGGTVEITTQNVDLEPAHLLTRSGLEPGPYVCLTVTDTGSGMDTATQELVFEPFFTTKEKGKGTGLGLSTVYGIIRSCKGHIILESEEGKGTSFRMYFPRVDKQTPIAEYREDLPAPLSGNETILVVDDQPDVMQLVSETLHMHGYRVLEASNAGSALLICEEHQEAIDLLIVDVIMPKMNGVQLAHRLWHFIPDLRVIFMSGYTHNIIEQQGDLNPSQNFIQKPFSTSSLLRMVRKVLDE